MATGSVIARNLTSLLEAHGLVSGRNRILDFGCGVGRVTLGLAEYFERCDGVDISETMIKLATQWNTAADRVQYHVGSTSEILFPDQTFDVVYSRLVLQHVPVRAQAAFIAEFVRVLRPRGVAVFQTPSKHVSDAGDVFRSPISTPDGVVTIDMNVFPRAEVEKTIAACGGTLIQVVADNDAGPQYSSFTYILCR